MCGCYSSMKPCCELQPHRKKLLMQSRLEFTKLVSASVPKVKTWVLFLLAIPSFSSMISVKWSSSFTHETFKDKKKDPASMKFVPLHVD